MPWSREEIAERAAKEICAGDVVNLGIGIPTLVANNFQSDAGVTLHSENGLLGMGPFPTEDEVDAQVINAGKQTVTVLAGGSTFDSALSFSMIRGGHVDVAMLGAMQVSASGDLANWMVPGKKVAGIGGAMDLASGAKKVIALLMHCDRNGNSKLVPKCTLPLTALNCVNRIITDLGVFEPVLRSAEESSANTPQSSGFRMIELGRNVSFEKLKNLQLAAGAPIIPN